MGSFTRGFASSVGTALGELTGCLVTLAVLVVLLGVTAWACVRYLYLPWSERMAAEYEEQQRQVEATEAAYDWLEALPSWVRPDVASYRRTQNPAAGH